MTTDTLNAASQLATHNGYFTVRSTATGDHRTFRVWTQDADAKFAPGERIVALLTGPDNEADYTGFGFLKADGTRARINVWHKRRDGQYDRLAAMLEKLAELEAAGKVEINADTRCRVCNRRLTTPESVESGIGPICAGR